MKNRNIIFLMALSFNFLGTAQDTIKAAFLGNSYTYYNDLPVLIDSLANANGDDLVHQQNTPGGYTLEGHSTNATSLGVIAADTWDYVVLQEQSQRPSFPYTQVIVDVYPKAEILCDSIRSANECAIPVFFNTWGRLNGDPQWDSINTFERMNNRLYLAYNHMAIENSGILSPVGLAFKAVYDDMSPMVSHNSLYAADGSHPSIYGSYLAACIFYNTLFDANAVGNTFIPAAITQLEAAYLQQIAFNVMYMATSPIFIFTYPASLFTYSVSGNSVTFNNESLHAFSYLWDFGDNTSSTMENPVHTYSQAGNYTVKLTASYCDRIGTYQQVVAIADLSISDYENNVFLFPNPTSGQLTVEAKDISEVVITDLQGKIVYQHYITASTLSIDLSDQLPGVYLLKLTSHLGVRIEKIIKH